MDQPYNFNNSAGSSQNSSYSTVLLIVAIPIGLIAAFVAWSYLSGGDDLHFDIEWKFWRSTFLWPALSFIGFFLQFIDWQHTSFREGWVVKDSWGREKFVADNDIMSVLWGQVVFPLLAHFLFIPCIYGALLYYVIIIPLALLNAVIPYLAALLAVTIAAYFYIMAKNFGRRTHPYLWLFGTAIFSVLLLVLIYLPASGIVWHTEKKPTTAKQVQNYAIGFTEVKAKTANLRKGPGTSYDFYTKGDGTKLQAHKGERLEVIEDQGEWFKIKTTDGGTAFIKKTLCTPMTPYTMGEEEAEETYENEEIACDSWMEDEEVAAQESAQEDDLNSSLYLEDENVQEYVEPEEEAAPAEETYDADDRIYDVVEEAASFYGGDEALTAYIKRNLKYPANAQEQGIQGRVTCQFTVEKDGSLSEFSIIRSPDPSLSNEALRILKGMPKWSPAMKNGKAVRYRVILPIRFSLQ